MKQPLSGIVNLLGRLLLCALFFLAAVGNKIPNFNSIAEVMGKVGIPAPKVMLVGAIAFLILGSVSIVLGFRARLGALLLLVFLVSATYYFHNFWDLALDDPHRQEQQGAFLKNLSLMGAMLMIIANGVGSPSLDHRLATKSPTTKTP